MASKHVTKRFLVSLHFVAYESTHVRFGENEMNDLLAEAVSSNSFDSLTVECLGATAEEVPEWETTLDTP